MTASPDPLAIVEASYRLTGSTESWLDEMLRRFAQAVGCEARGLGALFDATRPDWVTLSNPVHRELPLPFLAELLNQPPPPADADGNTGMVSLYRSGYFGVAAELGAVLPGYAELLARFGIEELTGFIATDPTFKGCVLAVVSPRRTYSPRTRYQWRRLAMHITAGLRLRRQLADLLTTDADITTRAEAVLTPERKVEHAVGPAVDADARAALQDALVRIEAARNDRQGGMRPLGLWSGLVSGRWSLVEHFERDGRRYFLAYRNDPEVASVRALTPREAQVWYYAAMGQSNKLIAYALGLSIPTVAGYLRQARRKLGGDISLAALARLYTQIGGTPPTK